MTYNDDTILYLCRKEVEQVCKNLDSVSIIHDVFRMHGTGQTILPDEAYLGWVNSLGENVRSLNMPGYIAGTWRAAGTKIINGNIANPQRNLARASGLTLLHDALTGRVLCIMEAATISSLRTAGVTMLVAELCKGPKVQCAALIGAGVLAQAHISILTKYLPHLREVQLFDMSVERAQLLKQEVIPFLQEHDVTLQIAESAEQAIRMAQLVVPVTTTTTGYIHYDWLQPGTILVNISLDDALPEVVLQADKVIVDDWTLIKTDDKRLLGRMYRAGSLIGPDDPPSSEGKGWRQVDAQIAEIVIGNKAGRESIDDIIFVNPFGMAIEDIAIATHVYQTACENKLGIALPR